MCEKELDEFYKVCYELTIQCGKVISDRIGKEKAVQTKSSDIDFVTETDQEVEKLLIDGLLKHFPTHKFIGEESVAAGLKCELTDDPTWILDPIDGTTNYVHGLPLVAISIGLLIKRVPVIGIIYNPLLVQMFTARLGQGAFLNGLPIHVSSKEDLTQALVCSEVGSSKDPERIQVIFNNLKKLVGNVHGIRLYGSACVALSMVANGSADAFCHIGLHCWDLAGGWLIVKEAGGVLLDYKGSAALSMASVASGGIDVYHDFGIHAWDMAAGAIIVEEAGGTVLDTTGGPFDILSRRVVCASSMKLAKQIAGLLEAMELERD